MLDELVVTTEELVVIAEVGGALELVMGADVFEMTVDVLAVEVAAAGSTDSRTFLPKTTVCCVKNTL